MSIALARRYRPRRFAELLVQDHVAQALRGAVARERVGHGYLLTGPRGVGKTTAARILAMALNCAERGVDGEPCGRCESCTRIWNGQTSLDVVEIDAASNRGVDDARELRESAMYAASTSGHHKVYIIDEAHMLTREAWNALLKILEEPPPGVVFIFATTEPQKIANTAAPVMSRLQRFDFRRIGPAAIRDRLRDVLASEGVAAEDDALLVIARHADGGMRDALSVLDQCLSFGEGPLTAARVREVLGLVSDDAFEAILDLVAERRPGAVFATVDTLTDAGADLVELAGGLGELLRAVLMAHYQAPMEALPESTVALVERIRARTAPEDVVRMLKLLGEAEQPLRRSANPRLVFETLLLRWALMDRAADLKALLEGRAPATAEVPAPYTPPPQPTITPSQGRTSAPAYAVPWTDAALAAIWPEVVEAARRQSPFLAEALEQAIPAVGGDGVLELRFGPEQAVLREGVERQLSAVTAMASARAGRELEVRLGGAATATAAGAAKGGRLSVEQLRHERLSQLRRRDPALDAAADALDLELLDDR
jgi:DNA polymerase-3 subunit gamma/tau